jgi:hypothetical protein
MLMHPNVDAVVNTGIEDKLGVLRGEGAALKIRVLRILAGFEHGQQNLNYVIPVHV